MWKQLHISEYGLTSITERPRIGIEIRNENCYRGSKVGKELRNLRNNREYEIERRTWNYGMIMK